MQFTSGGRNVNFQIPAGATQAVFSTSTLGVQTGTVAGTITITLQIFASGADVTPTPPPTRVLRIAAGPPVITSASLVANTTGFSLNVVGYATSREVTGATIHLTAASRGNPRHKRLQHPSHNGLQHLVSGSGVHTNLEASSP